MLNWLKALVVVAALMGGLPDVVEAHARHAVGAQTLWTHSPQDFRESGLSTLAANPVRVVVTSAFERQGKVGGFGPCCCQTLGPSCPPTSSNSSLGGIESGTDWALADLVRHSKVIRRPTDSCEYAAPYAQLDRPPKGLLGSGGR